MHFDRKPQKTVVFVAFLLETIEKSRFLPGQPAGQLATGWLAMVRWPRLQPAGWPANWLASLPASWLAALAS